MCGIAGFNWSDKILIKKMVNSLKHRGPDDSGKYINDQISLGHTRLSIIDLTSKGKQPIHNEEESIWIVFNGEIYNYRKIKEELEKKGHKFYTNTDTEVIIHAYEEYGYDCLKRFNGQFAFCIYDSTKKILFCARDRFGIKPFYYYYGNGKFIFSSEIKTILKADIKKEINRIGLKEYFNYRYTLSPNTLFKNIFKLKPSHYIVLDLKSLELIRKRYYNLKINQELITNNDLTTLLVKKLTKSVKLRMIADVPVACLLSGGLDSSIITGIASYYNHNVNTFSVGFETSSELNYAKIVAEFFNTNHYELIITNDDVPKNIEKMIYHMDEPIGDPGFFPTLLISELASKYNKVVLAGEGADEIFGGYDKYKLYYYGQYLSKLIPKMNYKQAIFKRLSNFSNLSDLEGYLETIRVFNKDELNKININSDSKHRYWDYEKGNLLQKMQFFDINTLMPEDFFMKADKMSSAYGLEERVPYMDHNLVQFALNIQGKLKLRLWEEKLILKKAFNSFLPKIIIKRRKRGYNVPMDYWFKTVLRNKLIDLIDLKNHTLYNQSFALKLLNDIQRSGKNYKRNFYLAQQLWTIYIFEEWYESFM